MTDTPDIVSGKERFPDEDLEELLDITTKYQEDPETTKNCLAALANVLHNKDCKKKAKSQDAVNKVKSIQNHHPLNQEVQDVAGKVLKTLGQEMEVARAVEKVLKCGKGLSFSDPRSQTAMKQACTELANLMSMTDALKTLGRQEKTKRSALSKVIGASMARSKENPELLAAEMLLASRMA